MSVKPVAMHSPVFLAVAPHFTVPDVVAAAKYWCEVLGFENLGYFGTPPVFAMVRRGAVEFYFNRATEPNAKRPRAPVAYDAYVQVSGLARLHEELVTSGASIVEGPVERVYGMRELVIEDCHGLRIAFGEDPGRDA